MDYKIRKATSLNPELEALRNRVLQNSVLDDEWIQELINKTKRLHVGFLFEDHKTLQDLCLYIGETSNKVCDPGWQTFGYHLGLNPCLLRVINHNNFNKEDPTYNTLLAYVQYEDSTIGKVIQALHDIGRIDVISRVRESITGLADLILRHNGSYNLNNVSYESSLDQNKNQARSGVDDVNFNHSTNSDVVNENDLILKPNIIPPAPFIFQNIKSHPEISSLKINDIFSDVEVCKRKFDVYNSDVNNALTEKQTINVKSQVEVPKQYECLQTSKNTIPVNPNNRNKQYGKIIMLTFADDGEKYAQEICKVFRNERQNFQRIGVLVLSEHIKEVNQDPVQFVMSAFHQVDYVCPILTQSYFNLIKRKESSVNFSDFQLDSRYAQLIYILMNKYYVSNACLNDKIRCIIPDELLMKIQMNLFMSHPIFSAWVKLSEVDNLAVMLLKSKT